MKLYHEVGMIMMFDKFLVQLHDQNGFSMPQFTYYSSSTIFFNSRRLLFLFQIRELVGENREPLEGITRSDKIEGISDRNVSDCGFYSEMSANGARISPILVKCHHNVTILSPLVTTMCHHFGPKCHHFLGTIWSLDLKNDHSRPRYKRRVRELFSN